MRRVTLAAALLAAASTTAFAQTTRPSTAPATRAATSASTQPATKGAASRPVTNATALAHRTENTHGGEAWESKDVLTADLYVEFGGNVRIDGPMAMRIDTSGIWMEPKDGVKAVWTGDAAWVSPDVDDFERARFHLLTWPYFLAAPFKIDDPGTNVDVLGTKPLQGESKLTAKLTFDSGVGDAPDDWYVLYMDQASGRLDAMSYIVTYTKSAEEAEESPHAIVYGGYETVDGVALSTEWTFYKWSEEEGVYGDPIGNARLTNVGFRAEQPGEFAQPAGAEEDKLPSAG